jgi:hypothetical protein
MRCVRSCSAGGESFWWIALHEVFVTAAGK